MNSDNCINWCYLGFRSTSIYIINVGLWWLYAMGSIWEWPIFGSIWNCWPYQSQDLFLNYYPWQFCCSKVSTIVNCNWTLLEAEICGLNLLSYDGWETDLAIIRMANISFSLQLVLLCGIFAQAVGQYPELRVCAFDHPRGKTLYLLIIYIHRDHTQLNG